MAISELQILFRRCFHRRLSAAEFREVLKQYNLKQRLKSRDVVSAYINCVMNFCIESDPLLPYYLTEILQARHASLIDFITALLLQWKQMDRIQDSISAQIRILTNLNVVLATNVDIADQSRKCIIMTARWLGAVSTWALTDAFKDNLSAHNLTEVIGMFLVTQLNYNSNNDKEMYDAVQQALDQCMGGFPSVSMELMNKLNMMQKPIQDRSEVDSQEMGMAAIQFEEGTMSSAVIATRSGTVALLQHLLSTGSTIDDSVIYTFLNTRHSGDHAIMFNDLVFASIDSMIKSPPNELHQNQCQLFILNKLPFILSYIVTSSFESFSSEQNIVDVWNYVNAANPDFASTIRRFVQICSFHHLISSETVASVVGEDTSLKGLYAKDDLVAQVTANHSRGPRLIDEMLKNDGNAGSISQAIYEVMNNYCHMRETQHLKDMANMIVRKPAAINAIGMFIKPALFLNSFCTLIDEWKWDDIHGESQPVYDEFGSVFLLILAFKQRLRLTESEIGIQKAFLAQYFSSKNTEQSKLPESTQKHLGDWIKSLYIDEGLSDELTANCSAQDFYMLVPTLLRHSVTAYSNGKLSYDTLKAGLEYLLEPFLLPSLLPAFGWIEHISITEPKIAQLVTQILTKQPSGEAREIHQTVLAMAGDRLQIESLPKSFGMKPPQGDWTQIASETYISLESLVYSHGPTEIVRTFISMLLQGDFHTLLDFVATMIVVSELQGAVQVLHSKLGYYLKKNELLFAEAVVHLNRRVELYTSALTAQDLSMEPFVPMNVANVNLDAVPETFQQPTQNEDIDQVLNEAAAMGMDQLDNANLDNMYLQSDDFGLANLDDLDLDEWV